MDLSGPHPPYPAYLPDALAGAELPAGGGGGADASALLGGGGAYCDPGDLELLSHTYDLCDEAMLSQLLDPSFQALLYGHALPDPGPAPGPAPAPPTTPSEHQGPPGRPPKKQLKPTACC